MNAIEYANKADRLFSVPKTALKIKELSDSNSADLQEITRVVAADPGLAAHILKLANSAIYRFTRKIEKLDKAIQVIGLSSVYEFALAFAISDSLTEEHGKFIDIDKYWFQSLSCAIIAQSLSNHLKVKNPSRLFLAGLFHNIGELAVLRIKPALARECSLLTEGQPPKNIQNEQLGFTYAEISAALLQKWMLPDSVVSAVAMQHFDDPRSVDNEALIMQLAYLSSICLTYPKYYSLDDMLPRPLFDALKINYDPLREILQESLDKTESTIFLFQT